MQQTRPLVPEDRYRQPAPRPHHLQRAAWSSVRATIGGGSYGKDPVAWARGLYRDDEVTPALLQRAAVAGANTTTPEWAGMLAQQQVASWLGSLGPASAAASLIPRGVTLTLSGVGSFAIPLRATAPTAVGWVDEQGAVAVRSWAFTTVELGPARKMAVIVVLSKELASNSDASAVFDAMLREEAALSLDTAYFSTDDGSAAGHHPGLLAGVTPLAATAGGGSTAMISDLTRLAAAVSAGGSGQVVFVMGPGRASTTGMRSPEVTVSSILPSLAVPEDRVIAIDPLALVHGFGGAPEIRASEETVLHMSDTPVNIGTPPDVVAAPSHSMFQTAQIAMRMLLDIAFAKRRAGCVAYLDSASWGPS